MLALNLSQFSQKISSLVKILCYKNIKNSNLMI